MLCHMSRRTPLSAVFSISPTTATRLVFQAYVKFCLPCPMKSQDTTVRLHMGFSYFSSLITALSRRFKLPLVLAKLQQGSRAFFRRFKYKLGSSDHHDGLHILVASIVFLS
ncbi:unnamed protein product [Scytosiphon promiscuus]